VLFSSKEQDGETPSGKNSAVGRDSVEMMFSILAGVALCGLAEDERWFNLQS
jgi:hypothetical protein